MSDDKRDRDPWDDRYAGDDEVADDSEISETSETSERPETSKTSKSEETADTSESAETSKSTVRDRKNVNMYLPDGLVDDLQLRYSELNVEWRRQHDDDLPKNERYYPAVIRAALEGTTIEEELGLD
jgi:hypothetical protein